MLFLVFILLFLSLLFVSLTILVYARDRMNPATQRLLKLNQPSKETLIDRITRQEKVIEEKEQPLEKVKEMLAGLISSLTAEGHEALSPEEKIRFSKAGIRGQTQLKIYLGIRTVLSAAVPSLYLLFAMVSGHSLLMILLMGLLSFLVGRFMFVLLIRSRIKKRNKTIGQNIHDAIDLLTICLEAGLGLNVALLKVGENLKYINIALADEFLLLNHEIQAGSRKHWEQVWDKF
jgi:pilus assembly protein TadC